MKRMPQPKIIIIFISVLFFASSVYLFAIDSRYNDPKYNKSWYALSFADPKSNSLDFAIENFSNESDFHWELLADKIKVSEGDVQIGNGEKKDIKIDTATTGKKTTITVSSGNIKQEIYKNISE